MVYSTKEKIQESHDVAEQEVKMHEILLFNDDVNTFDFVIDSLIEVCEHTPEQAEQCTWLIHFKGKCSVKKGDFTMLKPMKSAICEAGIDARIL